MENKDSKASLSVMESLHNAVAVGIINRIKSGEATSQDYSNAIRMLKDNGITLDHNTNQDENYVTILESLKIEVKEEEQPLQLQLKKPSDLILEMDEEDEN